MATNIPKALEGRLTVNVDTASDALGISPNAYRVGFREGWLPGKRLGRRIVVPVHLLLQVIGLNPDGSPIVGDGGKK